MQATSIKIERVFFLGAAGSAQFPESVTVAITWSLEGETIEEAEAVAVPRLYEMADRERRRRYEYLKKHAIEKKERKAVESAEVATGS